MDRQPPLEKKALHAHLRDLGEQLLCEPDWDREALEGLLDEVLGDIQALHQGYEKPAPEGAEAVQAFVLEALDLYSQCVESMKSYLEEPEEARLRQGLEKAEEAEDILVAVDMVLRENMELLDGGRMA